MTRASHVWERRDWWDVCARCGVVRSLDRETPCRGVVATLSEPSSKHTTTTSTKARARRAA